MVGLLAACDGGQAPASSVHSGYPASGLVLLTPTGSVIQSAQVGSDVVAVTVSDDGKLAYVADSAPGDVYAVELPDLQVKWKEHVGGAPFGLLIHGARLYVSTYTGDQVWELDPATGVTIASIPIGHNGGGMALDAAGGVWVASDEGYLIAVDGAAQKGDRAFSAALVAGTLWTADYPGGFLSRVGDTGFKRNLPRPLHPFWVAPGAPDTLLISAEGNNEDSDQGAVYAYDVARDSFTLLDSPLDPDQAVQWGPATVVAAHGSRRVDVIDGGHVSQWAKGAAAVAVAPDSSLNLLVVAVNSHE